MNEPAVDLIQPSMNEREARTRAETIMRLMREAGHDVVAIIDVLEGNEYGENWHVEVYTPEQWAAMTEQTEGEGQQ